MYYEFYNILTLINHSTHSRAYNFFDEDIEALGRLDYLMFGREK